MFKLLFIRSPDNPFDGMLIKFWTYKTKINYSSPFFSLSLCFLTLLGYQDVRELIRGGEDHPVGQAEVSPWSELPFA